MKEIAERIAKKANQAIAEKVFPGCVIGIVTNKEERHVRPFGNFTYDRDSEKVEEDTIYDVASISKSIPTASLAVLLIEEGKLRLLDKIAVYLPELKNHFGATIEDLLRYRVHGSPMSLLKDRFAGEIRMYVLEHGFDTPPGKVWYTNVPAFLLGLILEKITDQTLDDLAQRYFFTPEHMNRTSFFPSVQDAVIAPTEISDGGEIRGIVHDESARVFARARRAVGHAGLFSTAPDLLNFLEALLVGRYPYIVECAEQGLGWQVNDKQFMGKYAGNRTFGKTGFTGTSIIVDRDRGIVLVILSNRTYPSRPPEDSAILEFRADIADMVLGLP